MGSKEDHRVTPHNKPHTRDLLGKTERVLAGREAATEQEAGFMKGCLGAGLYRVACDWWHFVT